MVSSRFTMASARWTLVLSLACAVLLGAPTAKADHTENDRQTEWSAYTLQRNQWKLGLFKFEYGIFNQWSVGTYTLPWLVIPLTQSPSVNASTKVKLVDSGKIATSFRMNAFWFDVEDYQGGNIEDGDFRATIFPLTAAVSYVPHEKWTVSTEATWVQTVINGDVSSTGEQALLGAGAQNNLQFALTAEWRLTNHIALNLVTRVAAFVSPARINSTAQIDEGTTADIEAEVTAKDAQGGFLIQPGFTGSWGIWNVRAGIGYGNLFIPGLMIVGTQKVPVPDLDFYIRF